MTSERCHAVVTGWTVVILWSVCLLHHRASAATPLLNEGIPQLYAEINEHQLHNSLVTTLSCTDDDVDDVIVVNKTSTIGCDDCFTVRRCGTNYCLSFLYQGFGALSPNLDHVVTVDCTDFNETVFANVIVRVRRNSPPFTNPVTFWDEVTFADTKTTPAGTELYTVTVVDWDGDSIDYELWYTQPQSDHYELGQDGVLRAKNDLVWDCKESIQFFINVSDPYHDPRTFTLTLILDGSNKKPYVEVPSSRIQVPEDTPVGSVLHSFVVTDDDSRLNYALTIDPAVYHRYFTMNGNRLQLNDIVDYEQLEFSEYATLTLVVSDGYCHSDPVELVVEFTNVNEPPYCDPVDMHYRIDEGIHLTSPIDISPNFRDDDDGDDKMTVVISNGNTNYFSIDNDGHIYVKVDYDLERVRFGNSQTLRVELTDQGGLTGTCTVNIQFNEWNDNAPVLSPNNAPFRVCEDVPPGRQVGSVTCTDRDENHPNNAANIELSGATYGLHVNARGHVYLLYEAAPLGSVFYATVRCVDQGQYKGRLTSETEVPITVVVVECPTPPPPATTTAAAPTTTTTVATTTTTTAMNTTTEADTSNRLHWLQENMWWIILGGLLLTALLGLLAYMCCVHCYCCCRKCCRRSSPKPPRPKTVPRKVTPAKTQPKPTPEPTPPLSTALTPDIKGESAALFPFWQEKYANDDYKGKVNRNSKPRPITPLDGSGNGVGAPGGDAAPKKKSRCHIL